MSTAQNAITAIPFAPSNSAQGVVLDCTSSSAQPVMTTDASLNCVIYNVRLRAFSGKLAATSAVSVSVTQNGNTRTLASISSTNADITASDAQLVLPVNSGTTGLTSYLVLPGQTVNVTLTPAIGSTGTCKCDIEAIKVL